MVSVRDKDKPNLDESWPSMDMVYPLEPFLIGLNKELLVLTEVDLLAPNLLCSDQKNSSYHPGKKDNEK